MGKTIKFAKVLGITNARGEENALNERGTRLVVGATLLFNLCLFVQEKGPTSKGLVCV